MVWIEPHFSKEEINAAGKLLSRSARDNYGFWSDGQWSDYWAAVEVINNWRASHGYPLNAIQMNLRTTARRFDDSTLVAQRIKRLVSIAHKLDRFPSMKLSQMQDLGGCRAIFTNALNVRAVQHYYERESGIKHTRGPVDDYIAAPKSSGYRGVHLIFQYCSDKPAKRKYNDLKIEVQLRSRYQHAWATAVETVGTFSGQALKSSLGSEEWQRFFSLMGSAIALRERSPLVPGTPLSRGDLLSELHHYVRTLNVDARLREYGKAIRHLTGWQKNASSYLLQLDPSEGTLNITGFGVKQAEVASAKYSEAEQRVREKPGTDAVLVSVESITALQRAYPNYFADTRVFALLMNQALSGKSRGISVGQLALPLE